MTTTHKELQCPHCFHVGKLLAYNPMMDYYDCTNCKTCIPAQVIYQFNKAKAKEDIEMTEQGIMATEPKRPRRHPRDMNSIYRQSVGELLLKIKQLAELRTKDATEVPDHVLDRLFEVIFIQTDELLNVHYQGVNFYDDYEKENEFSAWLDPPSPPSESVKSGTTKAADITLDTLDKLHEELKSLYKQQLAKWTTEQTLFDEVEKAVNHNDKHDNNYDPDCKFCTQADKACNEEKLCNVCKEIQAS